MSRVAGQGDVEQVREATDLVALIGEHIALRPRGREHVGLCPFHDDHTPSFCVVTHKGNAFYKCHSCGAAGDALRFVMEYHKLSFPEALRMLADRAGIELQQPGGDAVRRRGPTAADLREVSQTAARLFQRALRDASRGAAARAILAERGMLDDAVERFGLGFAPAGFTNLADALRRAGREAREAAVATGLLKTRSDGSVYDAFRNRLIFPIHDELGRPIAFGGRRIDPEDEPKYLNSSESPLFHKSRTLYGLHLAKRSIIEQRQAVIVEGYTDVIACHQAGLDNVVGTLGTALTTDHARVLSRLCETVVLVFDGDEAGQRAADRGVDAFFSEPVDVRICVLPEGQDPDDLLGQPDGASRLREAIAAAKDALEYLLARFAGRLAEETTLAGREKLLGRFLGELADLGFASLQGVRKRWVVSRVAEMLGVSVRDIERAIPQRRRTGPASRPAAATAAERPADAAAPSLAAATLGVSRSRRLAEHGLLAVLVYEPSAGLGALEIEDARTTIVDLFSASDFLDPAAALVAAEVLDRLRRGEAFTVDRLLESIEDGPARDLASRLFFEGEQRCDGDGSRAESALLDAVVALRRCVDNEHYRRRVASRSLREADQQEQLGMLADLIEQRRRRGDIASAIHQEVRQ